MSRLLLLTLSAAVISSCGKKQDMRANIQREAASTTGMVWIPGGTFQMGSNYRPYEKPVHKVTVEGFWMDSTEVTNAQFAEFVKATGYVTTAEKTPKPEDFPEEVRPHLLPELLKPGSNNFRPTEGPVPLDNELLWWEYKTGADWRHPSGPESSIEGKEMHPVVCVNWEDASAYAEWAGKRLPTEAEWEFAARGGLSEKRFVWGDQMNPDGKWLMNAWQGGFPAKDDAADGFHGTAPAKSFPANGYGLYDMSGNVWEWTGDWFDETYYASSPDYNPRGPGPSSENHQGAPCKVIRGGSWLCNDCYCEGYRPAARMFTTPDTASNHTGFRCVKDKKAP